MIQTKLVTTLILCRFANITITITMIYVKINLPWVHIHISKLKQPLTQYDPCIATVWLSGLVGPHVRCSVCSELLSLPVIGQFVFIVTDFMGQVGGYLRQYSPQFIADNNLSRGTSIARHFLSFYSFYQTPITTENLDSSRVFKHFFLLTLK